MKIVPQRCPSSSLHTSRGLETSKKTTYRRSKFPAQTLSILRSMMENILYFT